MSKKEIVELELKLAVGGAVDAIFDKHKIPVSERIEYLKVLSGNPLSVAFDDGAFSAPEDKPRSWADRVGKETRDSGAKLPDTAPATWKNDKLPDDTPPDFIKRHYGPEGLDVLRADGTGLKRNDLKRLDPSAYMALANWLRNNELPDDCPLPTKAEANELIAGSIDPDVLQAAAALAQRQRRGR